MKKITRFQFLFFFTIVTQLCLAQVDVIYKDLVWSDEFSTNGSVEDKNWFHQTQLPNGSGWNNNEVQHYTNQTSNSFVDAGYLHIVAKKETFKDQGVTKEYTSARLNSKFAFKYGRVDVRAKLPIVAGSWPAIWLLGKNINEAGSYFASNYGTTSWPACGEIDIMEHGIFPTQSINYIQSTLHTPSSNGNSVNNGGIIASDLANTYHVYSMNWSPNRISFLLDDVIYYTYEPTVKNDSTWPFDKEQFLLLNVAMGGWASPIPSNFVSATMDIDYVRVYQNTTIDTEAPKNFTASVGVVTGSSVAIEMNATDNSGNVTYIVDYGTGTSSTYSPSGTQKTLTINNLNQNTNYTFNVTATDASGNVAVSSPIVLNAKTTSILQCSGTETLATQGSFSLGYKYAFETIGTDVKVNYELLDTDRVGVVAYLWKQSPFSESQMSNVSGNIFTKTITGQTIGTTIIYACKFAFAGGLSVTKYISYVVGGSCSLGLESEFELKQFAYPNPVENAVQLQLLDYENQITLTDILGRKVLVEDVKSSHKMDMSSLKSGIYFLKIDNSFGIQNIKIIKK